MFTSYVARIAKRIPMYAKTDEFDNNLQDVANIAKALSHPARLAILQHLAVQKSCYSGNIAEELPLSRTTVSQHLQELKRVGLIQGDIEGTRICYCINGETYSRFRKAVTNFFDELASLPGCDCERIESSEAIESKEKLPHAVNVVRT